MELKEQVVSLELAKQLKELGVKQESLFYYKAETENLQYGFTSFIDEEGKMKWAISAFTVAELGEMLPVGFAIWSGKNGYTCGYSIEYLCDDNEAFYDLIGDTDIDIDQEQTIDENPANAMAEQLIYLLENNLIEIKLGE